MKNLHEQALEIISSNQEQFENGSLQVYIRRYFGERNFRLGLESGVPVPGQALYEMSKNPKFEEDQIDSQWWMDGDDEFLIAKHVIEYAEKAAKEIDMIGVRFKCEMFAVVNSIRYWSLSASYREFNGACPVFDVNGVRYFLLNIQKGYEGANLSPQKTKPSFVGDDFQAP